MRARETGWWWHAMDSLRQASSLNVNNRNPRELRELAQDENSQLRRDIGRLRTSAQRSAGARQQVKERRAIVQKQVIRVNQEISLQRAQLASARQNGVDKNKASELQAEISMLAAQKLELANHERELASLSVGGA